MDISKEKLDLYKAVFIALRHRLNEILSEKQLIILHLYLIENKSLTEIADYLQLSDYQIVKDELKEIKLRILALG